MVKLAAVVYRSTNALSQPPRSPSLEARAYPSQHLSHVLIDQILTARVLVTAEVKDGPGVGQPREEEHYPHDGEGLEV